MVVSKAVINSAISLTTTISEKTVIFIVNANVKTDRNFYAKQINLLFTYIYFFSFANFLG